MMYYISCLSIVVQNVIHKSLLANNAFGPFPRACICMHTCLYCSVHVQPVSFPGHRLGVEKREKYSGRGHLASRSVSFMKHRVHSG